MGNMKTKNNRLYTTKDVLSKVGVTRPTLYKWFKEGKISEVMRDRNRVRLFTKNDMEKIFSYKNLIKQPSNDQGRAAGNPK